MMHHCRVLLCCFVGVLTGVLGLRGVAAAEPACTRTVPHNPNVILFLLDDTSAADIPFLNPPTQWSTTLGGKPATTDGASMDDARLRHPDLNRTAARLFAEVSPCSGNCDLGANFVHPDVADNVDGAPVAAYEYTSSSSTDYYVERCPSPGSCVSNTVDTDILTRHGGMRRLAEQGVVFPRFYATSGRCTPTRASVLSGKHPRQIGIVDNGNHLKVDEATVGKFMKSLGYVTGHVGKWHVGATEKSKTTPWQRGTDEIVYFKAGSRPPFSNGPLSCSPPPLRSGQKLGFFCADTTLNNTPCNSNSDCTSNCNSLYGAGVCKCDMSNNRCYQTSPKPCDDNADCGGGTYSCTAWGMYVGRGSRPACPPSIYNTDPNCCAPPESAKLDSAGFSSMENVYDFAAKTRGSSAYWLDDKPTANAAFCDDDNHYEDTSHSSSYGCRYDTRFYRDMATNFISRHQGDHFFLEVALHAQHSVADAPVRTLAHHGQSSSNAVREVLPHSGDRYWASMEEVDAAIGDVLATLDGVCSLGSQYAGRKCTIDTNCGTNGDCNTDLAGNTIVMMTSDQGRPGAGYGGPEYRDGKGSTYEGGVRVGLLAYVPGASHSNQVLDGTHVGSQVDLLPTIADAVGCDADSGSYKFGTTTASGVAEFCTISSSDWSNENVDCNSSGCCKSRLAGRSLLPELTGDTTAARPAAFAAFHGAPKTIITQEGFISGGTGICAKKVLRDADTSASVNVKVDEIRYAASCLTCSTSNQDSCTGKLCISSDNYCVPGSAVASCKVNTADGSCSLEQYPRCSAATGCGGSCMQIAVACDACVTPQWKFMGTGGDNTPAVTGITPVGLYDLASNPPESDGTYKDSSHHKLFPLNCIENAKNRSDPSYSYFHTTVADALCKRLDTWNDCVAGAGNHHKNCDFISTSGSASCAW